MKMHISHNTEHKTGLQKKYNPSTFYLRQTVKFNFTLYSMSLSTYPWYCRYASDNLILFLHDMACSNNNNVIIQNKFCLPDHYDMYIVRIYNKYTLPSSLAITAD